MMRTWLLPTLLLAACASTKAPELAPDEVAGSDVFLPDGARAGMYAVWHHEWRKPAPDRPIEQSVACVGDADGVVTMEWRKTQPDGATVVVAARFRREDEALLGAWRGPSGGVGVPVRVVDDPAARYAAATPPRDPEEQDGIPIDGELFTEHEVTEEEITTPAGTFLCTRHTALTSIALSASVTSWYAKESLPLTSFVKCVEDNPFGDDHTVVLVAYGATGAEPSLRIPEPPATTEPR
jgi:hypothetical protein